MTNKHFFNIESIKPQKNYAGGSKTSVTGNEISSLVNMSFSLLKLQKGSCHEALWHPNAHKIGYCQQGSALVSILSPGSHEAFNVNVGDVFFVPKGHIHYIANNGDKESIIAFALSHAEPEEITVAKAISTTPDTVLAATFNSPPSFFEGLKKSKKENYILKASTKKTPPFISSHYKFNINASNALIQVKGGYLKASTKSNLSILQDLGILGFGLTPKGIVEPHWHTNAGELVYIIKGRTRMTVLAPDGSLDVSEVHAGGLGFAPASHFHSIENIGNEDVEVIAFFGHAEPDYIGIGEALSILPNDLLAETFNVPAEYFETFKAPAGPLVVCGG